MEKLNCLSSTPVKQTKSYSHNKVTCSQPNLSENKENICSGNGTRSLSGSSNIKSSGLLDHAEADRSLCSVRSGSSMDILVNGKLPFESTKTELVWGCCKIGRAVTQTFVLRNR